MGITYDTYYIKDQSTTKNNVYLIVDKESRKAAIIDPACSMVQINNMVSKLNLSLEAAMITHTHYDHIRCVNDLVNQYGCDVYVSKKEAQYYLFNCLNLRQFNDEEILFIGKTPVKCLLTPGHTKGSTCFLLENSIFTGDTVFIEGCGMCTTDGGSAKSMFYSITRIKEQVGDSVQVYPGHTYDALPGKTVSYLKKNNVYFVLEDEKKFIEFRMRKNQTNLFDFK